MLSFFIQIREIVIFIIKVKIFRTHVFLSTSSNFTNPFTMKIRDESSKAVYGTMLDLWESYAF